MEEQNPRALAKNLSGKDSIMSIFKIKKPRKATTVLGSFSSDPETVKKMAFRPAKKLTEKRKAEIRRVVFDEGKTMRGNLTDQAYAQ